MNLCQPSLVCHVSQEIDGGQGNAWLERWMSQMGNTLFTLNLHRFLFQLNCLSLLPIADLVPLIQPYHYPITLLTSPPIPHCTDLSVNQPPSVSPLFSYSVPGNSIQRTRTSTLLLSLSSLLFLISSHILSNSQYTMADKHPSAKAPQKTVVSTTSILPHPHVHNARKRHVTDK